MGHDAQYIAGPAMTALGAGLTATGAGAGIGPALIASGIGETAGGPSGGMVGAGVGGALSGSSTISKLAPLIGPAMQAMGIGQGQQQQSQAQPTGMQVGGQRVNLPMQGPQPLPPVQTARYQPAPPTGAPGIPGNMPPQVAAMLGLA